MLVGTYTAGNSEGIYVYRFDTKTGAATRVSVAQTVNPSFLVVSRDRRFVYAVKNCPVTTVRRRSAAASAHFASTPRRGN